MAYDPPMGPDVLIILIVILVVALMWRGPKTLPKFGAMFGRGVKSAREEARELRSSIEKRGGGSDS